MKPCVSYNFPPLVGAVATRNTILLQAVATLLIANSHLEGLYPKSWMAADGFIGNSLFFLLSGYGIVASLTQKNQSFPAYYWRRILRIYPTVWIVQIVFYFLLLAHWKTAAFTDYVYALLYPTEYTFVTQVMMFYVLFYLLKRCLNERVLLALAGVLFIPLLGWFVVDFRTANIDRLALGATNPRIWWIFFFQVMLLGGWLAVRPTNMRSVSLLRIAAKLVLIFAAYVSLKFCMVFGVKVPLLGFSSGRLYVLLHLLMMPLLFYAFRLGSAEPVLNWLERPRVIHWLVALMGGLTLEVYTVHRFVFENAAVRNLVFPLNVIVFYLVTVALCAPILKLGNLTRNILRDPVRSWRSATRRDDV